MTDDDDDRPQFYRDFFPRAPKRDQGAPVPPPTNGVGQAYGLAALNAELTTLAAIPNGQRNSQLNKAAFNLAQLVASGHLEHATTRMALRDTAIAIGLTDKETDGTLESAFGAGMEQPRVVAVVEAPVATTFTPDPEGAQESEEDDLTKRFPLIDWPTLWDQEDDVPWLVEPLIPARRLVALFSPAKVGKSLFMLEVAVELSRGGKVLDQAVERPMRVLYVDFENDPRGDVRTRLRAMHFTPAHLGNLLYLSFPSLPYLDTPMGGLVLLQVVEHYAAEVVVIDTISRAVGGEENDNDTWLRFYRNTGVRLKEAGVTCIRLDHTGKDLGKGMRGGSAKEGDVDVVWAMTTLAEHMFQLDCTAHRLPVSPTTLTVKRVADPRLHHELVDHRTPAEELADWLDTHDAPVSARWGRGSVKDLLHAHHRPVPPQRTIDKALELRRTRRDRAQLRFDSWASDDDD